MPCLSQAVLSPKTGPGRPTRLAAAVAMALGGLMLGGAVAGSQALAQGVEPPPRQAGQPIDLDFGGADTAARARQDRIEELERQLIAQQAEMETVQRELFEARQLIGQLRQQLAAAEAAAAPPVVEAPAPQVPAATSLTPSAPPAAELFSTANTLMRNGNLPEAEARFRTLLSTYPTASEAAESRFWLAEILMARGQTALAAGAYGEFLERHPRAPQAADAQARLGLALGLIGRRPEGCAALRDVTVSYPNASRFTRDRVAAAIRQLGCPPA